MKKIIPELKQADKPAKGPGKLISKNNSVQIGTMNGKLCLMYKKNIIHPLDTELWFLNF